MADDLPEPLGPRRPKHSPMGMPMLKLFTATLSGMTPSGLLYTTRRSMTRIASVALGPCSTASRSAATSGGVDMMLRGLAPAWREDASRSLADMRLLPNVRLPNVRCHHSRCRKNRGCSLIPTDEGTTISQYPARSMNTIHSANSVHRMSDMATLSSLTSSHVMPGPSKMTKFRNSSMPRCKANGGTSCSRNKVKADVSGFSKNGAMSDAARMPVPNTAQ
mmetsp:Transcript_10438/g.21726  ORF Transcript_10438/g.21726 Transcript_10438/m.21726 type:complete len:220 (-) Transcript_10438:20-679(-)